MINYVFWSAMTLLVTGTVLSARNETAKMGHSVYVVGLAVASFASLGLPGAAKWWAFGGFALVLLAYTVGPWWAKRHLAMCTTCCERWEKEHVCEEQDQGQGDGGLPEEDGGAAEQR